MLGFDFSVFRLPRQYFSGVACGQSNIELGFGSVGSFGGRPICPIYESFCDTFASHPDVKPQSIVFVIVLVISSHIGIVASIFYISGIKKFAIARRDRVPVVFCASQKTLALGIMFIGILFENDPNVGLISLPLVIWHPTQILIGGCMAPKFAAWVDREGFTGDSIKFIPLETINLQENGVSFCTQET